MDSERENVTEKITKETDSSTSDKKTMVISSSDSSVGQKATSNIKKRKLKEAFRPSNTPRTTPRRAASLKQTRLYDVETCDLPDLDEPDYQVSDSDDDPDFAPDSGNEKNSVEHPLPKKRICASKGSAASTDNSENLVLARPSETHSLDSPSPSPIISDNTISSSFDTKLTPCKLSSGYRYVASRTRQNQAVRLPEGPNLSQDQLKLIESQFKNGDFVMAKTDYDMMEKPPIWRIDGKSLLQKFQAFEKDGKTLYRNVSTYSGWTSQAKALYVPVKVSIVFQSRYDVVVELEALNKNEGNINKDSEAVEIVVPAEIASYDVVFEIYLQSLISQALDANFLQDIYDDNDEYFVRKIEEIDSLTEERRTKILSLASWKENFKVSLEEWPSLNTMVSDEPGPCEACGKGTGKRHLTQFYGQPYNAQTLRCVEPYQKDASKTFHTCENCTTLSELYNKMVHMKHEFYVQCKSAVSRVRVQSPNKSTTNILKDLLANDDWIKGLFRSMCTSLVKIDNMRSEQ